MVDNTDDEAVDMDKLLEEDSTIDDVADVEPDSDIKSTDDDEIEEVEAEDSND